MADLSVKDLVALSKAGNVNSVGDPSGALSLLQSLDKNDPLIGVASRVLDNMSKTPQGQAFIMRVAAKFLNAPELLDPLGGGPVQQVGIEPASPTHDKAMRLLNTMPEEKVSDLFRYAAERENAERKP